MALRSRMALLALVTVTTISVSLPLPAEAQRICYRPDGSMYAGSQPPPDCSPDRPKSRDEAIEREAAIARTKGTTQVTAPTVVEYELNRRLKRADRTRVDPGAAEQALQECELLKYRPSAMNAKQSALCNRLWQRQAEQTLRDADK